MSLIEWASLALVCLLGAMSPGPSLAVVVRNTIRHGPGGGLAVALAHGFGVGLYAVAVVSGLALVLTGSPILFTVIQWVGAAFLLYLGIQSLRSRGSQNLSETQADSTKPNTALREGFLVAFLNPKLAIFFLALFSQFLSADTTDLQKVIMVVTVGSIDALWYAIVTLLLSQPSVLEKLRQSNQTVDRVFGVVLIALAIRVVLPM